MAMFQQYQSGIQPVTGMAEAGANIGNMYAQGINNFTKGLAEGIKTYNDNSAKNELANQKIQSLSQDVANKIAMYSQDPEIAQSGVLEGLMQTAATLQDAPTKGLNQRIGLVHEAETRLAGFGNQLQEWSFLRGRAIERGIADALNQYAGKVKSTEAVNLDDPNFNINPNESIVQQKDRVMKYYGEIKKVNPKVQFNDQEFWQRWLAKAEQTTAKAQDIDPRIISAQLEAINAEKGITAQNRAAEGNLPEGAFQEGGMMYQDKGGAYDYQGTPMQNTLKDYEASMQKPSEVPIRQYQKDVADAFDYLGITPQDKTDERKRTLDKVAEADLKIKELESKIATGDYVEPNAYKKIMGGAVSSLQGAIDVYEVYAMKNVASVAKSFGTGTRITPEKAKEIVNQYANMGQISSTMMQFGAGVAEDIVGVDLTKAEEKLIEDAYAEVVKERKAKSGYYGTTQTDAQQDKPLKMQIQDLKTKREDLMKAIALEKNKSVPEQVKQQTKTAPIGLGYVVVGTYDDERNLSVTERKSKVQDFLTQRFGAIDPTDPTGKRKIPVQGFEQFFQKAVPESELQEYTTPSGIRLMRMNGKWEQMKMPEQKSLQDIRKEMIGVYGQQGRDGRLVPTEFLPNSGIYLGGLYRGGDAEETKYKTEMIRLTDARRGVKVLQEINDRVGEFADFKASGRAKVEVMNLKAALREDIIGVGTVSNFEQALIDEVIKDPTSFFSMEVRDRAILLALAERVDRRIRNLSAAGGLTVQIRDSNEEANKYESLRQRYLKEKYGI
jgi:hypothetical protein